MVIKLFDKTYFLVLIICFILTLILYFILRNKNKKIQMNTLIILSFSNFLLHFLKLLHPSYNNYPYVLSTISLENVCAVNTVLTPFILLSENDKLKDYLCLLGSLGGLFALFYPDQLLNYNNIYFEIFRFYYDHFILFLVPFLLLILKLHKLNLKRLIYYPITFLKVEILILINEIILIATKVLDCNLYDFFNKNYRNSAFIFGIQEGYKNLTIPLTFLTPKFLLINPYMNNDSYLPIIWLIIPSFMYLSLEYYLVYKLCNLNYHFNFKNKFKKQN